MSRGSRLGGPGRVSTPRSRCALFVPLLDKEAVCRGVGLRVWYKAAMGAREGLRWAHLAGDLSISDIQGQGVWDLPSGSL